MQDRYAGDIGDYGKIALLRELQSCGLSIAVNWYLAEPLDMERKADGTFKQEDGKYRIPEKMMVCDKALSDILTGIADSAERSVKALERSDLIPDVIYFSEPVTVDDRTGWHEKAMMKLASADVVFVDPDNGMLAKSVGKKSVRSIKYTFYEEVREITFPKCSVRDYLAVPASEDHREKIEAAYSAMEQGIWGKIGMCRIPR